MDALIILYLKSFQLYYCSAVSYFCIIIGRHRSKRRVYSSEIKNESEKTWSQVIDLDGNIYTGIDVIMNTQ